MKKLELSSNRVLLGVCGGLGEYFSIDPVWIRLVFAIAFFARGAGFGVYLVMWAIISLSNRK